MGSFPQNSMGHSDAKREMQGTQCRSLRRGERIFLFKSTPAIWRPVCVTKGMNKVAGAMMIPTNETSNLQTAIFTDRAIDLNHCPEERASGVSLLEPPSLSHRLTQNMTATWGN